MSVPAQGARRLAAIMFTDMVGFSSLTQRDERLALELLSEHRALLRPVFSGYGGREIKTTGDGFLVEFGSALDAAHAAVEMQKALHLRNASAPPERRVLIRIGIHLGDVVEHDGDIYGDGVNTAARIEPLAPHGGVCLSRPVYDLVRHQLKEPLKRLGSEHLKNLKDPIEVFCVVLPWSPDHFATGSPSHPDRWRAGILFSTIAGLSPLLAREESVAIRALRIYYRITRNKIPSHSGRTVSVDSSTILSVFPEALEAARCAVEIQREFHSAMRREGLDARCRLRMAVHEGEVQGIADTLVGEALNFSARLLQATPPGQVSLSILSEESVAGRLECPVVAGNPVTMPSTKEHVKCFMVKWEGEVGAHEDEMTRALAAVMVVDLRGFSSMMNKDESLALRLLSEYFSVVRPLIGTARGRELKTMGDTLLADFQSAIDAVRCGLQLRDAFRRRNGEAVPGQTEIVVGIGIHMGEVLRVEGEPVGEAVDWAQHLSTASRAEQVCVSRVVADVVGTSKGFAFVKMGTASYEWLTTELEVFSVEHSAPA